MIHRTIPSARRTSATTQHVPYRPSPRPDKRASNEKASSPLNSARYPPPSRQQVRSQRQPANGTTHASFRRTNTSQTPVVQRSVRINPGRTPQYATPSPSVVSARNSTMGFSNGTNHQSLWSASNPLQGQSPSHEMPEDASSTIAHTLASSVAAPSTAATGNDEGSVSVPLPVSMAIINNSNKTSSNITRGILRQSLSVSDVIMCAPVIFGSTAPILWKGIESPAAPTISSSRGPGRSYPTPRRHSFITAIQTVRRPRASSDAHQHRIPSPETSMSIAAPNDVCKYPPEGVNDEEDSKSVETVVAAIRPTVQTQWDDGQANSAAPISATASMTRSSPSERLRNRMQRVILVLDSVGLHILNYTENSNSVANSFSNSGASNPSTPIQRSLLSPMELAFFPRTRIGKTQSLDPATSSFDAAICPAIETDSLSPPSSPYARSVKWSFVLKIVTVDGFTSILYFDDAMHRNAVQKVIIAHCRLPLPVAGPHHRTRSYSRKSSGAIGASNVDASHPRSVSQSQRESVPPSRLFSDETGNGNEDVHSRSDSMVRDSAARGNLYPHNINVPDSVLDRLRRRLQRSMTSMDSLPHVEPQELTGVGRTTGHSSSLSQSSSTAPSINARGVVYAQVIVKTQAHAPSDSNALECDAGGFELPSRPVHSSSAKSAVAPNVRIAPPDVTIRTQQPVVPSQLHNQPPTATAILVEREPQTINVQQRFHPSHTYQADFSTYPHASDAHTLYARKDPVAVPVVTSRFTALEKRLEEARARRGLMNLA